MYYVASSVNGRSRLLQHDRYVSPGRAWRMADKLNAAHCANGHQCDNSCVYYFACDEKRTMVERDAGTLDMSNPDPDREIRNV